MSKNKKPSKGIGKLAQTIPNIGELASFMQSDRSKWVWMSHKLMEKHIKDNKLTLEDEGRLITQMCIDCQNPKLSDEEIENRYPFIRIKMGE